MEEFSCSEKGLFMAFLRLQIKDNFHQDYKLEQGCTSIGRTSDNDIIIKNPSVSKKHARLNFNNYYFLTDLLSANGTFLNGKKILHVKLSDGDTVNFAGIPATFYD